MPPQMPEFREGPVPFPGVADHLRWHPYESRNMTVASLWARRNAQAKALASAIRKRELPTIELTDEELALLKRADALVRKMRIAEAKAKR